MNQATAFVLLMEARWTKRRVQEAAALWHIAPSEVQFLSRSALRVASVLNQARFLTSTNKVEIAFDDGSSALTNCLGSRFYK